MEGKQLGDYQLIKQVGQGSLGTAYLAEHRFMKKQFVLKVLPEELSQDRMFIQRFEEDVSVLSHLEHPNIVKLHNISFADGRYFLVTDCIVDRVGETTNIGHYVQSHQGGIPQKDLERILFQIAGALDHAHGKHHLAHRGIKLNNILIGHGKEGVNAYLSDFGLSRIIGTGAVLTKTFKNVAEARKILESESSPEKLEPLQVSFLQNYCFLAPEQKNIYKSSQAGVEADRYAFGVLVYYLLTHDFPEGIFEIPKDWTHILVPCLQKDPLKRPKALLPLLQQTEPHPAAYSIPEVKEAMAKVKVAVGEEAPLKPVIQTPQIRRPEVDPDPGAVFQVDTTVKHYEPAREEVKHIEPLQSEMVVIQGGTFYRGSDDGNRDEKPRHQVHLNSFAIDIHPVTNEQFVRFLEIMGGVKDSNHNDIILLRDSRIKRYGGKFSIESGYVKHPVVGVTWYGAVAYAMWVGKRLPTEAEWEIAARGLNDDVLYPSGDDIEKSQANFFSSDTTSVMSYAPNSIGLYDMAGNVYEWCQDWYGYNYYELSVQEPECPLGPLQGVYRVLRGGCWKSLQEDLRCSRRHRNNPGTVNGTYGFRCAADVQNHG